MTGTGGLPSEQADDLVAQRVAVPHRLFGVDHLAIVAGFVVGRTGRGLGAPALVVYCAQGYDKPVTDAFTKATGIQVELVDVSTGPLLTKIAAEGDKPQWDVLWVDGDTAFASLDKQGKLAPNTPATQFSPIGQALIPAKHSYVPASATVVAALIYDSAKTTTVPASYQDLLGSNYTGKVGMNDPAPPSD